ncbi:MAG: diacylglycerol kinase family lipid kinase [Oscillospiraceae bacterium]|nr:diacylglycerol kinase family lipid kinase [Oscillospiraceae bacterium]
MKHLFIINPIAGKGNNGERLLGEISRVMEKAGANYECAVTKAPMDACRIAREACESGEELRIYACGGDGTLNEVVNGAAGFENAAVTQYPCGSGNDFLKMFGNVDSFKNLEALMDGQVSTMDLIDCNGRLSVNICSVGFDARIGHDMIKYKHPPLISGKTAYIISAAVNIIKGIHLPYKVFMPDRQFDDNYSLIVFANGQYYGGSFNPTPDAVPDDGLMDILMVEKVSRFTVAKLIGRFAKGMYKKFPELMRLYRHDTCTVRFDRPTGINVDGEVLMCDNEAVFKISDKKINIFYPAGVTYKKNEEIQEKIAI